MTDRRATGEPGPGGNSPAEADAGRADLHLHTLASDGTAGVLDVLTRAAMLDLQVIAITDHERIDSALAAQTLAVHMRLPFEVVVGEEISTRGGHLLGLFLTEPIRPWQSLRKSIAAVHDQGGLAIPAHPLFPYPLCAQGPVLRRLLADHDHRVHPDGLEAFNPTTLGRGQRRVEAFIATHGLAGIGSSDAHALEAIGQGYTTFPGRTAEDLRSAILERRTGWGGVAHPTGSQLSIFGRQLRKRGRDVRAEVRGRVRRDGTGRDHGYPGGRARPPRYQPESEQANAAGPAPASEPDVRA